MRVREVDCFSACVIPRVRERAHPPAEESTRVPVVYWIIVGVTVRLLCQTDSRIHAEKLPGDRVVVAVRDARPRQPSQLVLELLERLLRYGRRHEEQATGRQRRRLLRPPRLGVTRDLFRFAQMAV